MRNSSVVKIRWVFETLHRVLGPQGWWPLTPPGSIHPIHDPFFTTKLLTNRDRTEIIVGAILTQNTAWTNVEKAIANLNTKNLVDLHKLARARQDTLARAVKSAGYFNQKASRLKSIAAYLVKNYDGDLSRLASKPLRGLREELLSLHGIGEETADSMLLYALNKPIMVVDAYARRICFRLGLVDARVSYGEIQGFLQDGVPQDVVVLKEFHALLVGLAKQWCRAQPRCPSCPLLPACPTGRRVHKGKTRLLLQISRKPRA